MFFHYLLMLNTMTHNQVGTYKFFSIYLFRHKYFKLFTNDKSKFSYYICGLLLLFDFLEFHLKIRVSSDF